MAFNNNDAVLALGDDELKAPAPAVANLDTFSCYAVFGTPTAASQTLITNRISGPLNGAAAPKFWTLRSSSFRDATGEYSWTLPVVGAVTIVAYFVSPTRVLVVNAYGDTLYDSGTTAPVDRVSGNIGRIVNGAKIENGAYVNHAVISEAELLGFSGFHANDRARILNTLDNLRAAYAV